MLGRAGLSPLLAGLEPWHNLLCLPPLHSSGWAEALGSVNGRIFHDLRLGAYADRRPVLPAMVVHRGNRVRLFWDTDGVEQAFRAAASTRAMAVACQCAGERRAGYRLV